MLTPKYQILILPPNHSISFHICVQYTITIKQGLHQYRSRGIIACHTAGHHCHCHCQLPTNYQQTGAPLRLIHVKQTQAQRERLSASTHRAPYMHRLRRTHTRTASASGQRRGAENTARSFRGNRNRANILALGFAFMFNVWPVRQHALKSVVISGKRQLMGFLAKMAPTANPTHQSLTEWP